MWSEKAVHTLCAILLLGTIGTASAGLVAYYPLDGDAKDTSGVGTPADGILVGSPTFDNSQSAFGKAIKLDGTSQYVNLGNPAKLQLSGPPLAQERI